MAVDTKSQSTICHKVRQIDQNLKVKTVVSNSGVDKDDFKGSRGWFDNF